MNIRHSGAARAAAIFGAAALVAAGCGGDDASESTTAKAKEPAHSMKDGEMSKSSGVTTVSEAADTKVTLARLLAEHTSLATIATTRALEGGRDFDQAAAALNENGEELGDVIGSVYGDEGREQFMKGWNDHIGYLVDYTTAVAKKDDAAKQKAVKDLGAYVESFGTFLATATDLPPQAVKDGLQAHVQHHAGIIDAYAAGNYRQAHSLARAGHEHMVGLGETLGGAIAEQQDIGSGNTTRSAVETRLTLGRLLAEHSQVAFVATTDALADAPDFPQAAASLKANSEELGDVIGSVYGDDGRETFMKGWNDHIGYLVDYTTAVAKDDDAAKQKAVDDLDAYVDSFGGFLATATDLPPQAVKDGLKAHVQHHAGAIDAFAAKDYDRAYELDRAATEHMWMLGGTLSEAIVKQNPDRFGA